MKAKWDNLFWYQRANDEGEDQLENNTTKGFLKILQESEDRLTDEFLQQFFNLNLEKAEFEYDAQVGLNDFTQTDQNVHLVGISYEGQNVAADAEPQSGNGRVDGIITVHSEDPPTAIAIEVKTGRDTLGHDQMGKYRGELGIEWDQLCHGLSWLDIYDLLGAHREQAAGDVDRFLLKEFTDYLELMRMVPFRGFDRERLRGPGSTEYKQELLRGVDQKNTGIFSQSLYDKREACGLEAFMATSNQKSREVHLAEEDALEYYPFSKLNHFSAGFWHAGRFSVQLYITRRVVGNITQRGSIEPSPEFVRVMRSSLQTLEDIQLTTDDNPFIYMRYQRNIQQPNDSFYDTFTFPTDSVVYAPEMTDETGLDQRLSLISRSVREATNAEIGQEKSFVIEKQIPYDSDFIDKKELVDHTLEFFESLLPVYEYFSD